MTDIQNVHIIQLKKTKKPVIILTGGKKQINEF